MSTKSAPAPARTGIAICWFKRDSYDGDKSIMADPDRLYGSFDQWLKEAKAFEADCAARQIVTRRIRFDRPAFILFCSTRNLIPDAGARMLWANEQARKADRTSGQAARDAG